MIKVGLTGGIGSGKSYVSLIFKALNVPVYDSDIEAKKLYYLENVKSEMMSSFGKEVYLSTGEINKIFLSELIFYNKKALTKVNTIIHPRVKAHFLEWQKNNDKSPYILKETAIIFESGAYKQLDKVIVVTAPEELRLQRVLSRDKIDETMVKGKMDNQMAQSEMVKRSDFVIVNDQKQALLPQIDKLHHILLSLNKV